jgi:hypothetical protein
VLRWRLTASSMGGGLVPFLISWSNTEHPARSAPQGLTLEAFYVEHPDPSSLAPLFTALGADIEIRPAAAAALVAHLSSPNGSKVLQ